MTYPQPHLQEFPLDKTDQKNKKLIELTETKNNEYKLSVMR